MKSFFSYPPLTKNPTVQNLPAHPAAQDPVARQRALVDVSNLATHPATQTARQRALVDASTSKISTPELLKMDVLCVHNLLEESVTSKKAGWLRQDGNLSTEEQLSTEEKHHVMNL